jgi:hypothetical protein
VVDGEAERMAEAIRDVRAQAASVSGRLGRMTQEVNALTDALALRDARITELEAEVTRHRTLADPCPFPPLSAEVRARQAFLQSMPDGRKKASA